MAENWEQRSFYLLLTDRYNCEAGCTKGYCGGTWAGIEEGLEHITDLGFDAVWISPIVENTEGPNGEAGYHGYWAKNFEKVNPHFGTEESLKSLVSSAHAKDMAVVVDIVANHVGYVRDFSEVYPFNEESHYHEDCSITDWYNFWQLENCRLFGMPDLAQEN